MPSYTGVGEGKGETWDGRRGMLLKLPLLIRWTNFSAARETLKPGFSPLDARVESCICTRALALTLSSTFFFFSSSLLSLDDKGVQRVSVARGCPFVQDVARPRFDPSRPRPWRRSSIYRIKPPCRRVHLVFYGLICLAATVTTSRKNDFYFCSRNIRHSLVQP